jgi:membrane protein
MVQTFRYYAEDDCGIYAAAIAYYAIFSLVPLALITLSIFGLIVDREAIVDFVFEQVPLEESAELREDVNNIVGRARNISLAGLSLGFIGLIWSSSGIFGAVRRGLNATSHRRGRPFWRAKLIDITLVPSIGILILLSIGLTATAQFALEQVNEFVPIAIDTNIPARLVTTYGLPAVVSFTMFIMLYRYVPSRRPTWGDALISATFATVLFEVAKNVFAIVIGFTAFTQDTAIYAGFSTPLIFLFWTFINASILLLGSEFTRALSGPEERTEIEQDPLRRTARFWRRNKGVHEV